MNFEATMGLIRHVLTFGGGALVSGGMITEANMTSGVGAIATLIGIIWSGIDKWRKKAALDAAIAAPAGESK